MKHKKVISKVLTFLMLLTVSIGNIGIQAFASDTSNSRKMDIWDFGGIQTSGELYNNIITPAVLDSKPSIKTGTFVTTSFGDITIANPNTSDRAYYYELDGTTAGVNSAGYWGTMKNSYSDGYNANGVYYANGTGGNTRRYLTIANVVAGDKISVYGGVSAKETIHFVHAAVSVSGTTVTVTPDASQVQDSTAEFTTTSQRVDFIAQYSGSYQIYVSAASGKPYFHRVVRTPGVKVTGTVNLNGSGIAAGYNLIFTNQTKGDKTTVAVNPDNTFDAVLAAGYDYNVMLKDITSYRISDETKVVSASTSDIAAGKNVSLQVVENKLVNVSGNIKGFDSSYNISKLQIQFTPPAGSLSSPVTATVDTNAKTFTADIQDGVQYTAVISGVNDYEIVGGGTINISANTAQDITVAKKAVHAATGKFQGLSSTAQIQSITFTNVADGYVYTGTVANGGYSVSLRDGAYTVTAVCNENYSTSTHVVMNGQDITKDILFISSTAPAPLTWVPDLYVGDSSKSNNFTTVKEALAAAARMNPTDEAHRITIHIKPGVYRAQLLIKTPYISLVNTNPNPTSDPSTQVKITWYYGIGYKYYSAGSDGYYNEESAFDKYSKNIASKWGGTVLLTSTATDFKAKNIVFENSFNKYMTDEELADGVELANIPAASPISVDRKSFTDVTSKTQTERAAAMIIEGNRAEFEDCSFLGSQDTLYTGGVGTNSSYFKNSFIEGNTDYIFGDGNAVFDNCILNFAGYSDKATGGYITAAKDLASYGYLFRNSTVTANSKLLQTSGFFGRPWGAGARVNFLNTKLQNSTIIDPKGWADMSNATPESARFGEYNTTYNASAVDTTQRRAAVLGDAQANAINVANYFGGWVPSSYTADSGTAPTFKIAPIFTTNDDINIPYTGNIISLGYEFTNTNDNANDSSLIQWYRVSPDGTETLITTTTAYISKTYKIASADVGNYIKAVVTPETVNGLKGTPMSIKLDNLVRLGSSGNAGNEIPDGQLVNIYIAGDSTVKTYGPASDTGGWGEYLQSFFNSEKVKVVNYANGGRSSRSFINEGSLDKIASTIKTGDYLLVQFGHNDESNQTAYLLDRFVSMGAPDANGVYPSTPGVKEATPSTLSQYGALYYPYTSGTFKWYLQQYIDVAKKAGATPILVTPVSRKYFNTDGSIRIHHDATDTTTGTITTTNDAYVRAVQQLGQEQDVKVINMFDLTKASFEKGYKNDSAASNGSSSLVNAIMAPADSTHNNKIGGFYNGALLAKEVQGLGYNISNYVIPPVRVGGVDSKNTIEFEVDASSKVKVYTPDTSGAYTNTVNTYWTGETQALINSLTPVTQPQLPTITSIVQPADVTVTQGGTAALPSMVKAVYSDGTQKDVAVTWDAVNTANVGSVDVHGTVAGYTVGVTVKVTVTAKVPTGTSTIWIIGDSTVSSFTDNYYYPRYGWGTQIGNYLDGSFTIKNIALSGRSSKSYTADPEYQTLLSGMKSGDYLLIGFGHNDEKAEADRYTNPNGTYLDKGSFANSLYENYIKPAQAAGTKVILNTPIVRRTATGAWSDSNVHITATSGEFAGGDYSKAIKDLGAALQIPVVDLTSLTKNLYDQLGPNETLYLHAWTSSKPESVDNTHTNIWGGKYNAYLITKQIKELGVSGLAEHVIDASAPTKASTLVTNPNYKESGYTGNLPQSTLWQDFGIWKGTVFGDLGGALNSANHILEKDSNGNMHIAVLNNKGKIASTADGFAMYYYKVPVNSTFTLTAKAKVNSFSVNDQVSFGLMARDEMYIDSYMTTAMGDYVAAAPLKLTKAATGGFWNSFARKSGVLTQGGTAVNPIAVGDTVDLRLEGNSDGYMAKFGQEAPITGGFDFKLTSIDPNYVYVGMFVARNADVTFSDIKLVVDGVEVTTGSTNPTPIPDTTEPADPNSTKDRELRKYALEGYAAARGVTGGGLLQETSNRYWKVATAEEFLKAIADAKSSGKASVIELTNDVALGSKEIGDAITKYSSIIKPANNQPLLHPTLLQTGVSTLQISGMSNLTIFSKNGAKLTHSTIDIRNSSNIIIRNLVFDELWEWDEATHGDYDRNDWDYITIEEGSTGIWIDHSTFYKAYDGIVDVKKAGSSNTSDVTISWSKFLPESKSSFFDEMMNLLEANPQKYPYYQELLTTHGMSKDQIRKYSAAQKKTHLIGASDTEENTSNLRITLANNYYKNSMDRMPRVRKGNAHVYNTIMDATELYDLRNSLTDDYAMSKVVSNGSISTQGASVLVENSSISGIMNALLSGNGSSPAGYIGALNSVYYMGGIEKELTVTDSTYSGLVLNVAGFKNALPYRYNVYDARSLASSVLPYAGAGAISMSSVQWQKTVYNNLADNDVQAPTWVSGSLSASNVTNTGLTLTWSGAIDNVGVTGYKLYWSTPGTVTGVTYLDTVTGATYTVNGLTAGTPYTFKVEAIDAAGNESTTGPSKTITTANNSDTGSKPAVPANVTAVGGNKTITLTWSAVPGAWSYSIYELKPSASAYSKLASGVTGATYTIFGLNDNTTYTYVVTAVHAGGESDYSNQAIATTGMNQNSTSDSRRGSSSNNSASSNSSQNTELSKDGVKITTGEPVKEVSDGKTVSKVAISADILTKAFEAIKSGNVQNQKIVIEVKNTEAISKVEIPASTLAAGTKAAPDAVISIQSSAVTYDLKSKVLDVNGLAKTLGTDASNVKINITIEQVSGATAERITAKAKAAGITLVSAPVEFNITAEGNGKTVSVNDFGTTYISRTIVLAQTADFSQMTAVMIHPETGEMTFVPAVFETVNGKTEVTIKRPGNSMYTVVKSFKTFDDVTDHWSKNEVELLASKLVIKGMTDHTFAPDNKITRAEFASLLSRALGLTEDKSSRFSDVPETAWYAGTVGAAAKAGLITGYENGTFMPNDTITREQMALMVNRALLLFGKNKAADTNNLEKFNDANQISGWAKDAVAQAIAVGLMNGTSDQTFDPAANATRAEATVILKRMMQLAELIN